MTRPIASEYPVEHFEQESRALFYKARMEADQGNSSYTFFIVETPGTCSPYAVWARRTV